MPNQPRPERVFKGVRFEPHHLERIEALKLPASSFQEKVIYLVELSLDRLERDRA